MKKWWVLYRQAPRYVLAATVFLGSTVWFLGWLLFFHSKGKPRAIGLRDDAGIRERALRAEARFDYLFLADDDLYDAGTGECLFKRWLKGDQPTRLFYDPQAKKIIGEYSQGFARYAFNGTREATMMLPQCPPAIIPGGKQAVFAKGKNIWIADVDWQKFAFVNQRQVTTTGVFNEQHFAENVPLLTGNTLVVRNLNNLLRVNLRNGEVHPSRLPLGEIAKRRSPDSKRVAGFLNGQFYCYDVDADTTKTITVGRSGISDFQWLGNDKCVCLAARQKIVIYDRPAHTLTEVAALPFACFKIGEPSPDGRFIFAAGGIDGKNGTLVDLEKKSAVQVTGGAGICWVSNDTFAFSREIPDSSLRGTWLQTVEQAETRVSTEPYLFGNGGAKLLALPSAGLIIFATVHGLTKMKSGATQVEELLKLPRPPNRMMGVSGWRAD